MYRNFDRVCLTLNFHTSCTEKICTGSISTSRREGSCPPPSHFHSSITFCLSVTCSPLTKPSPPPPPAFTASGPWKAPQCVFRAAVYRHSPFTLSLFLSTVLPANASHQITCYVQPQQQRSAAICWGHTCWGPNEWLAFWWPPRIAADCWSGRLF